MAEYVTASMQNFSAARFLSTSNLLEEPVLNENSSDNILFDIDNDFFQHEIYYEVRRNNSNTETWHHFFGVFGTLFSLFGILGNILSIVILLKSTESNLSRKRSNERSQYRRRSVPSIDYRLISFYSYLTALSFCDLFSCIFAILNVLEYLLPHYLEMNSLRYHEICTHIQIYTHPIATTLQALSCWLICAFSIHRCKSIAKLADCFSCLKRNKASSLRNSSSTPARSTVNPFRSMWTKVRASLCSSGDAGRRTSEDNISNCSSSKVVAEKSIYEMTVNDMPTSSSLRSKVMPKKLFKFSKITRARLIIILLYMVSILYLIPQWFEKKLTYIEVQHRVYVFTTITDFGQSKLYRQIFHLWFYMFAIYIIPFLLILLFNLILLKTFMNSKKRCSQYKLKNDPSVIIKEGTSIAGAVTNDCTNVDNVTITSLTRLSVRPSIVQQQPRASTSPRISLAININRMKVINKSRVLTLTLFGVVAIFFVCHFPAAVCKIIYVLYPRVEFESVLASFFLDLSNFLIMFNSSINWVLYIAFGPGKFRQEFSFIFFKLFKCFRDKVVEDTFESGLMNTDDQSSDHHRSSRVTYRVAKENWMGITIVEDEVLKPGSFRRKAETQLHDVPKIVPETTTGLESEKNSVII